MSKQQPSRPIRLEVTGTDSPGVSLQAPLWVLEGKGRYADAHPGEDIYIVHVLNGPRLKRPIVRVLPARGLCDRYPVEVKRFYGTPERYLVIPVTAPEIMREEVFFRWLAERTRPEDRQQRLPLFAL
ncbi:MAG TPA: hypothetical protein V6D00_09740 [Pantanalinema sp.]